MSKIKRMFVRFVQSLEKASQEKANQEIKKMGNSIESLRSIAYKEKKGH
jgi:hypothetical protein